MVATLMTPRRFAYFLGCVGTRHRGELRFTFGQLRFMIRAMIKHHCTKRTYETMVVPTLRRMLGYANERALCFTVDDIAAAMVNLSNTHSDQTHRCKHRFSGFGLREWVSEHWQSVVLHLEARHSRRNASPSSPIVISDDGSDCANGVETAFTRSCSVDSVCGAPLCETSGGGDGECSPDVGVAGVGAESSVKRQVMTSPPSKGRSMTLQSGVGVGAGAGAGVGVGEVGEAASTSPGSPLKRCRSDSTTCSLGSHLDLVVADADAFTTPPKHIDTKGRRPYGFGVKRFGRTQSMAKLENLNCAEMVQQILTLSMKVKALQKSEYNHRRKLKGCIVKTPLKHGGGAIVLVKSDDADKAVVAAPSSTTLADTLSEFTVTPAKGTLRSRYSARSLVAMVIRKTWVKCQAEQLVLLH